MYMWWLRAIIITSATSCALKERNKERECNRLDTAIVTVVVNKCRRKLLRSSSNPTLVVGETIEGKKEKKIRPKIPNVRTRNYMLYTLQLSRLGILLFNVVTTTLYKIIWRFAQRSVSQDSKLNNWNLYIPFCLIFCGPQPLDVKIKIVPMVTLHVKLDECYSSTFSSKKERESLYHDW